MKKITLLVALLLCIVQSTFAQDNYQRVSINNINESTIHQLDELGFDLTCGAVFENNQLTIELFDQQLALLEEQGIQYNVLIDNMQKFYSERAKADAPKALLEYEYEKALSAQIKSQRSFSVSEVINNIGQYNECDEIDWAMPTNWNLNPFLGDGNPGTDDFGGCLTYDMVLQELDDMRTAYPNLISVKTDASVTPTDPAVDVTFEGRTVYYVRISDNPDTDEASEPETLYQSLIHSREAATVMNQLYFMWYLLENYATDTAIKNLVDNQALYFIPVLNPDGFVWNETAAPNGGGGQRKNRNTSASGTCGTYVEGIDLNRNSAYYWGNGGSSTASCNDTYMGTAPFSENETQIMRDFFLDHDFELALNHHSYKNAMLHAYAGTNITNPRPDEYSKYNHDMTYYNRYAHGPSTSISSLNSGNMNDWMLGGPAGTSANGTPTGTGSGKETMAWTPENGLSSEGSGGTYGGFWPQSSNYLPIAKRAMRMNFMAAYFSGKYAKLHDLNQSDIISAGNLSFAIENLGQNGNDTTPATNLFTLTVTAVSSNITITTATASENFTAAQILDQRTVNIPYTLDAGIQADDEIEFKVVLTNDHASGNVLYEANIVKRYTPTALFSDNPDTDNLTNWTSTGLWTTTADAYSGTTAIVSNPATPYPTNRSEQLQMNGSVDLTGIPTTVIQYFAKWDLERSYDYVTIEGSTNGSTWTELCGKLTKPGAPTANNSYSSTSGAGDFAVKTSSDDAEQNGITGLYDGDTQDKWNMEEVVIDAATNSFLYNQSTVFLRFNLNTDSSNRKDSYANADFEGFTFDDFKIIEIKIPCALTIPTGMIVSSITGTTATVDWDLIPSATYDLRYREVGSGSWIDVLSLTSNTYNFTSLDVATDYEVQVRTVCGASSTAYTSSTNFSTTDPCAANVINAFPYAESFESDFGLWSQDTNDDFDWTRKLEEGDGNSTPSANTGPSLASDQSYFLFTEASNPNFPSRNANLISPCLDFTGHQNASFSFDYHMFGAFTGELTIDVSTDFGANYTTLNTYTLTGQQHTSHVDPWDTQIVDLSAYNGQIITLRFNATTGSDGSNGWQGDISIDNFNLTATAVSSAPPIAVCQNINVLLDNTGNATIIATDVDGGSTDDVAITNYSVDIDTFDCTDIGSPVNVTLTVTDGESQTDNCIAIVTVLDQVDPVFVNVPGNISLNCGNNNPTWTDPTATDNCDTTLTVNRTDGTGLNSGSVFPFGITTISYEVTDDSGNTETASFDVNIVIDNIDPVASCQNIIIQLDGSGNASIIASDINNGSSDNCGIGSIVASQTAFTCANIGTNNVTLTVTDTNGNTDNCVAVVTVQDTTDPVITCAVDVTIEGCDGETTTLTSPTATDACGIATLTNDAPATYPIGNTTVTWTATDNNGNTATCEQIVTVQDTTDPVCNTQDITVILDGTGNASITALDIDNGSSDNCGIDTMTVSPSTFTIADIGPNTVTLTITDFAGNSTMCNAIVTIEEETLSVPEFNINNVIITPNPFSSYIDIHLPLNFNNSEFKITIYDLNGRIVYGKTLSSNNGLVKVNGLENLEEAPYFIKVTHKDNGISIHKKLIKHE